MVTITLIKSFKVQALGVCNKTFYRCKYFCFMISQSDFAIIIHFHPGLFASKARSPTLVGSNIGY